MRITRKTKGKDPVKKSKWARAPRYVWQVANFDLELKKQFEKEAASKGMAIKDLLAEVVNNYLVNEGDNRARHALARRKKA